VDKDALQGAFDQIAKAFLTFFQGLMGLAGLALCDETMAYGPDENERKAAR